MTSKERFEMEYLCDDEKYLQYYCKDEAEAFEIERELSYNADLWLFEKPKNYCLEDDYGEESEP